MNTKFEPRGSTRTVRGILGYFCPLLHWPTKVGTRTLIASSSQVARGCRIGRSCRLHGTVLEPHVSILNDCRLYSCRIGAFSAIGEGARLRGVELGRFCYLGPGSLAGAGEHPTHFLSISPLFYSTRQSCGLTFSDRDFFQERRPIQIGNDVWVGARVFIRDGVRIGNGAIVAAGAVISRDVPDYAMVGGVPARVLRFRFAPIDIDRLLALAWWNWPEHELRAAAALFRTANVTALAEWKQRHLCARATESSCESPHAVCPGSECL
jgi:chloramphenicol O-acetyltransferase type B